MTARLPSSWRYDEFRQVGKDYGRPEEVEAYDASHARFRDVHAENERMLEAIAVRPEEVLIEFGTGTGNFAMQAATRCKQVIAVDVSEAMLDRARAKAAAAGLENIGFVHAGFLTYIHAGDPVDAIVSSLALHHLPDFWKGVALSRLNEMLKPGGKFYLQDVILEEEGAVENIQKFVDHQASLGGDFLREDAELHFKEEYSTYDWIMAGLLERAGFRIENSSSERGLIGVYLCTKVA